MLFKNAEVSFIRIPCLPFLLLGLTPSDVYNGLDRYIVRGVKTGHLRKKLVRSNARCEIFAQVEENNLICAECLA